MYQLPDFDATVSDYLDYHAPVYILKKPVPGQGGMGLFHRVRYKNKSGYMADTDVRMSGKEIEKERAKNADSKTAKKSEKKNKSKAWDQDDEAAMGPQPIYFTRYFGGALSRVDFTEKFSGKKLHDNMWMAGLRMTGPGTLFDGPPLDFNFWFSYQKPGYYRQITNEAPSGFLLFGDVMAMFPLLDKKNLLLNYGAGLMWTYTNYKVSIGNSHFDSQEFRVGFDFDFGLAYRIQQALVRLDAKYYWEKTQYLGYLLSVQTKY